jgi:flagellar basal-body rod protein FlgG
MAITALNSAATGLRALSTQIDVVANNLANAETTAFKRSRVNFEDLMYLTLKQPGATNAAGEVAPAGIFVGLGVKISNTQLDLEQGSLERTDAPLNVGIQGPGFFRVKILDSVGDGTAYTRNGNFFTNSDGELVLGVKDGPRLIPPITIPPDAQEINISLDGTITVLRAGQTTPATVGQLRVFRFINPQESAPGEDGAGEILQGHLEGSNVDPVKELVTLIKTQRSFELNSQSIQTADQALQTVSNLRRF